MCFPLLQVMVVPISENSLAYANDVRRELRAAGLYCDVDGTDRKMQKKVGRGGGRRGRGRRRVLRAVTRGTAAAQRMPLPPKAATDRKYHVSRLPVQRLACVGSM